MWLCNYNLGSQLRFDVLTAPQPKIDSATPTLGASLMTFRDEGSCSGGGVGRVVIQYELKEVSIFFVAVSTLTCKFERPWSMKNVSSRGKKSVPPVPFYFLCIDILGGGTCRTGCFGDVLY